MAQRFAAWTGAWGTARVAFGVALVGLLDAGCHGSEKQPPEHIATSVAALSGDDAGPPAPSLGSFGLYATKSVEMDQNSLVTGCNVGVEFATGPFLSGGVAASLNSGSTIQTTQTLYADSVVLNAGSTAGPVDSNHVTAHSGSTHGAISSFPAMPPAPTMPAATAGTTTVTVNSGTRTLSPGAYAAVTANRGATIALTGGTYVFSSLTLNSGTSLTVSAPTTLSITGAASFNSGTFVGPASGSGLTAKALILYVDSTHGLDLNSGLQAHALVVATNALVTVNTSTFYGAIAAAQIEMNSGSVVTCEDGFGCPGSCDDANPCTADACSLGTCTHTAVTNGTACSDGDACTQSDSCQSGACTGSNSVTCTASDQCHVAGTCAPSTGQCSNPTAADGTTCSDGNACTQSDSCQSGSCTGTNPVTCTASDQCHVAGTCAPSTGQCSNPTAANGTTCSDGNACTQSDSCQSGACAGSNPVACAAADQCHVAGVCAPSTGLCSNPAALDGTTCIDGNACTQIDSCQSGICAGSNPVTCTASDQCHVAGTCDTSTGQCSNPPAANGTTCSDGNACTQSDSCQSGACAGTNPVTCTASDQCHVAGTCAPSTGLCSNPSAANGTACSDGNACTQSDSCQSGACAGTNPVTCTASDQCHVAGTCAPSTGQCSNPAATDGTTCSDGNACTQSDSCQSGACAGSNPVTCTASDQCHVAGTCAPSTGQCSNPSAANGTTCSDGNACTQSDSCQSGACAGTDPVTCTASDQCHVAGTCAPSTGQCSNPSAANGTTCSDGNACTQTDTCQSGACTGASPVTCVASDQCHVAGTCAPSTGQCSNPSAANGASCNDGNACTQIDSCQSGACTGADPVTCTASDQCHAVGTCSTTTGLCSNPVATNGTACSDGNACTQTDTCQAGACTGASPVTCTALDACHTVGSCNPTTGLCSSPAAANGTTCSDGNACTQTDACQNGTCTGSNPVTCAASDTCHMAGTCNATTGACSNPPVANGTACNDGNACDLNDTCQAGTCTPRSHVTCTASDQCHVAGTCSPSTGQCSNPLAANGTACNDGNACDLGDTCQTGTCTAGSHVTCTAPDACHAAGQCDPASGTCSTLLQPDGTSCSDGNGCTQSDTCHAGTCVGANQVACPGDGCHLAGTCNATTGACVNAPLPDGTACSDGNLCTHGDSCSGGQCVGSPVTCGAPDACHTAGACSQATGLCSNPTKTNPFFDRIFEANSYATNEGPVYETTSGAPIQFGNLAAIANGWVGPIRITASGRIWVATDAMGGAIWDITAGGNFANATPFAKNLFGTASLSGVSFVEGFDLDSVGNMYAANSETGNTQLAVVAPNGTVTHTPTSYDDPCSLLVAEDRSCSPAKTLYISEGGKGRVISRNLATGVDTVFATGFQSRTSHVPGSLFMDQQSQLYVLWRNSKGIGIFNITAGGDYSTVTPLVIAPFFIDINECEVDSHGTIHCAGGESDAGYRSVRVNGVQQPFGVWANGLGDTEALAIGGAVGNNALQPSVSLSGPASLAVGGSGTYVGTVTEAGLPPGNVITYAWNAIVAPSPVTFTAPNQLSTDATFSAPGRYVLQLAASDGDSMGEAVIQVSVGSNQPPIVSAGSDFSATMPASGLRMYGSATDDGLPVGSTLSTQWTTKSGPGVATFSVPGSLISGVSFPGAGTYVLALTASDSQFSVESDVTATILAQNFPPTIVSVTSPSQLDSEETAALSAVVTDDGLPAGSVLSYEWSSLAGPGQVIFSAPTSTNTTAMFGAPGTYLLQFAASDTQLVATHAFSIFVVQQPAPTVVVSGPTQVGIASTAALSAIVTDPALPPGRTLTYQWSTLSGPGLVTYNAPTATATSAAFSAPGIYVVQFAAEDGSLVATGSLTIAVVTQSQVGGPVVDAGPNQVITTPTTTATLVGSATDTSGETLSYAWTLVSGPAPVTIAAPTQPTTTVTFSAQGNYVFQLLVSNTQAFGTSVTSVSVVGPPSVTVSGPAVVDVSGGSGVAAYSAQVIESEPSHTATTTWSVISGPGSVTFGTPTGSVPYGVAVVTTTAQFTTPGNYVLGLTAYDGVATTTGTIAVSASLNPPPLVSISGPNPLNLDFPANDIPLMGTVTDSHPTQTLWSLQSGPVDAVFSDPTSLTTTVSFPQVGQYVIVLLAQDSLGRQASATLTVTVAGPPSVQVAGPTVVDPFDAENNPQTYVGLVTEPVPGYTAGTTWSKTSGPGTVTFSTPTGSVPYGVSGVVSTTVLFSRPGTYVLELTATGGAFSASSSITVTVPTDRAPAVTVSGDQTLPSPTTTTVSGTATAFDPSFPLSYVWTQTSGPGPVTFGTAGQSLTSVALPYSGVYGLRLTVSDTQITGFASLVITVKGTVSPGPVGPAPQTPIIGGLVDDGVVTQPTIVTGTFANALWTLEYRLGGRDDVTTDWTTIATSTGAKSGGALGTFDPTLLLNGLYTVQLTVSTSGGTAASSVAVAVDGRMKVGNFTLAFTDLDVPVSGLPIQLIRTYDSRDKRIGDFGYGWNLSIRDVRVEKSGKTGAYWQVEDDTPGDSFIPFYCLKPSQSTTVTVTFPSGREYRFTPAQDCQALNDPPDLQDVTWNCTSDPNNPTIALRAAGSRSIYVSNSDGQLLNLSDDNIWDPRQFTFTNEFGQTFQIDQDKGVTAMKDRNGNELSITADGIFSSAGPSVPFVRDGQGRITTITDPRGHAMSYAYSTPGDLTSFTDRASNVTTFAYEGNHYLDLITDPLGRQPIRCDYDDSGRLIDEIDTEGHPVKFATNLAANQQIVTDRLGRATQYTYNQNGDITQKIDPTGAAWNYTIDARGNVLTSVDPLNHATTSTYDGANNLLTRRDALGNTTVYTYNVWRQNLTTVDPLGHPTTNAYDGTGNLTTTTDALGNVTHYGYDVSGNRTSMKDALSNTTSYAYDSAGHMTSQTDALTHVTSYTYDTDGNKLSQTQTRAGVPLVTSYAYDALSRVTTTTYPDLSTRSTTYTPTGKVATTVDELTRTTSYTYDDLDRLITTTRPDLTITTQTYDAENQRVSSTDAAGYTTSYQYDGAGRLTVTTHADATYMTTTYDAAGRSTATTDEAGFTSQTAYDASGRVTTQTDPLGNATTYAYDAAGNQTSTTDALGHVTRTAYDPDNRRVGTTYADNTSDGVGYDAAGRMTTKSDQLGRSTAFGYDAVGRLTSVTDPLAQVTSYAYDEIGERISQTDANMHVTSFAYDKRGRQMQRMLPDGASETMTYDVAGEKTARVDFKGATTTYGYDTLARLTSRTYPIDAAQNVSLTYTADGLRATAQDARGTTSYTYDNRRRLVNVSQPGVGQLSYAYEPRGLRTGVTATIGLQALTTLTTYDADGRTSAIEDPLGRSYSVAYDAASNRTHLGYPNTTGTSYQYDVNKRLTSLTTQQSAGESGAPVTVQSFAYTLDGEGKRTQIVENDGTVRQYGYDGVDRLTSEAITGSLTYAKTFAYDAVGNRQSQVTTGNGAGSVAYGYDSRDRMLTADGSTYTYDANGNALSKSGEATYTSDLENRLAQVVMTDGRVTYTYDVDGNRVKTVNTPLSTPAVTANALVDTGGGLSEVVAETDASGNLTALYVRAGSELLAVMRPGGSGGMWTTHFVHADALGSVRTITDETGAVVDTRGYEAFGTKNVEAGSETLAYGFAGEPLDAATHLAYHRARWMDSRVGRFEGMDPFAGIDAIPATMHKYAYTRSNSVNRRDPTGADDVFESDGGSLLGDATTSLLDSSFFVGGNRCQVTNLSLSFLPGQGFPALNIEARFALTLNPPSHRDNCRLLQLLDRTYQKGSSPPGGTNGWEYDVPDPVGNPFWWDGQNWNPDINSGGLPDDPNSNSVYGYWGTQGSADVAVWNDYPGYMQYSPGTSPVRYDGRFLTAIVDGSGHFVTGKNWSLFVEWDGYSGTPTITTQQSVASPSDAVATGAFTP